MLPSSSLEVPALTAYTCHYVFALSWGQFWPQISLVLVSLCKCLIAGFPRRACFAKLFPCQTRARERVPAIPSTSTASTTTKTFSSSSITIIPLGPRGVRLARRSEEQRTRPAYVISSQQRMRYVCRFSAAAAAEREKDLEPFLPLPFHSLFSLWLHSSALNCISLSAQILPAAAVCYAHHRRLRNQPANHEVDIEETTRNMAVAITWKHA